MKRRALPLWQHIFFWLAGAFGALVMCFGLFLQFVNEIVALGGAFIMFISLLHYEVLMLACQVEKIEIVLIEHIREETRRIDQLNEHIQEDTRRLTSHTCGDC